MKICISNGSIKIKCHKSQEPTFWEVMDSFVSVAYVSLAASRTLLQQLLACLNFTWDSEDLFCWYKQESDFYELKTMEISEVWPGTYNKRYIHQFQPEPYQKIQ